ncbi:hypothetical protein CLOSTASPAR_05498 [[Clostridium] asparagiforme DSM 15981]|uniref:Uncharacterized protein n=1 Tax=[Clostridium] asparagiforme DSM 15981 TaxID=518636 RepID=C0D8A0_9FIRM|nr:hypothetical protein CLOSTASPAR_05498 [[Clostridium] asparagiforme DSM 15981]
MRRRTKWKGAKRSFNQITDQPGCWISPVFCGRIENEKELEGKIWIRSVFGRVIVFRSFW